jgi:methionyl-tRNA formyltransferase
VSGHPTLSVIGFGSGSPLSRIVLSRVAREHRLLAIAVPSRQEGRHGIVRRLLGRGRHPLDGLGAPLIDENQVSRLSADVLVVASFPLILPPATLARATIGALNVHTSLLPRHRGPDPIFWTYMDDDANSGVTVHWMDTGIDTGPIAAARAVLVARGRPSRELYFELGEHGAELVSNVLARVAEGESLRSPQSADGASYQSGKAAAAAQIPFGAWSSERTWHVLRGLGDQFSGLLRDATGTRLPHGQATAFRLTGDVCPGTIEVAAAGFELHCRDGIVAVERRKRTAG